MAMASKIKITPTVINKMFKILARPRSDSGKILLTVVEVEVGKLDEEVVVCVLVPVPSSVVFAVPVATLSTVWLLVDVVLSSIWFILILDAKLSVVEINKSDTVKTKIQIIFWWKLFIFETSFIYVFFCSKKIILQNINCVNINDCNNKKSLIQ